MKKARYSLHWASGNSPKPSLKWAIYDWLLVCPVAYAETRVDGRNLCTFLNSLAIRTQAKKSPVIKKGEWLILEPNKRCYWRENRCGYSGILGAGLYTTEEADGIVAMGRGDTKVHVTDKYVQAELKEALRAVEYFGVKR